MKRNANIQRITAVLLLLLGLLGGLRHYSQHLPKSVIRALAAYLPGLLNSEAKALANAMDAEKAKLAKESEKATAAQKAPTNDKASTEDEIMPKGLTSVDGSGGSGFALMKKKAGVWFPAFNHAKLDADGNPTITELELMISSGPLPAQALRESAFYQAEAIGGTPPYLWSLGPVEDGLAANLDPQSGKLTFAPAELPQRKRLTLNVSDTTGTRVSAELTLLVKPEEPLDITTDALPPAQPETAYSTSLAASGGMPPYTWAATNLPASVTLSPQGKLSGTGPTAGEVELTFLVKDALDQSQSRVLTLECFDGLHILTPNNLPPATPDQPWSITLEAEGGQPPYKWITPPDALLPRGMSLESSSGKLSGRFDTEWLERFSIVVEDASGKTYSKTFLLSISDWLIAQAGKNKVGLAWQKDRVAAHLAAQNLAATELQLYRENTPIWRGSGPSFVDSLALPNEGVTYQLTALLGDGTELPLAEKRVTALPYTLSRAKERETADPYVDAVLTLQPLTVGGYGYTLAPMNVTGPPDGKSTLAPAYRNTEVLSLHASPSAGGVIELGFKDNIAALGSGEDITIFENVLFLGGDPNQRFMEPAVVSVALFLGEWHRLPNDVVPPGHGGAINFRDPFYYARGIAGRNATTGDDPTNPARSGGDSFDLDPILQPHGITWIRYIRIQSTGDGAVRDDSGSDPIRHPADPAFTPLSGKGASGFDLDAVSAIHY